MFWEIAFGFQGKKMFRVWGTDGASLSPADYPIETMTCVITDTVTAL
jgi:hypothetical protein